MDIARARYLVSAEGRRALAALDPALGSLSVTELSARLRKQFGPADAAALGEQLTLRAKARERFGEDADLLLAPEGFEMMTHPLVARRRAARLSDAATTVVDATCGLGGDLRAFVSAGMRGAGIERAAATALLASANVPAALIARGVAERPPFRLESAAVFVDPSRRSGGTRRSSPDAFSPTWDVALALVRSGVAGVMKAPPGIDHDVVPPDAELEFVQVGRGLREAALWFGAGAQPGLRRAVLLPTGGELTSDAPEAVAACRPAGAYLFDPESCVTRAGLVRHLAAKLGAWMLDSEVAYLSADSPAFDPMAATFELLHAMPFSVSRIKVLLRERGWAIDEIRRRAFPVEPDELRRLLGRQEGERVALLCTTLAGQRTVFFARRVFSR